MNLARIVSQGLNQHESVEWVHWITRTQKEYLEGREAEIAEEAYQQGLQAAGGEE